MDSRRGLMVLSELSQVPVEPPATLRARGCRSARSCRSLKVAARAPQAASQPARAGRLQPTSGLEIKLIFILVFSLRSASGPELRWMVVGWSQMLARFEPETRLSFGSMGAMRSAAREPDGQLAGERASGPASSSIAARWYDCKSGCPLVRYPFVPLAGWLVFGPIRTEWAERRG